MRPKTAAGLAALIGLALGAPIGAQTPVALKLTEFGHGPSVVLVHTLGGARFDWMPTARKLLSDHHVVMVDLPGHGESPMPDPFSFEACAAALDRVLAKQKPESTLIVGDGLGGVLSLMAARAHPEHLSGVILIDASLKPPFPIPDQQREAFFQLLDQNFSDFLKGMFTRMGRDSAEGVKLHAEAALVPAANLKAYFRALLSLDASGELKGLKTPLLFVGSSRVWPDSVAWEKIAKLRGYAEAGPIAARRVANSGVQMYLDQPRPARPASQEIEGERCAGAKISRDLSGPCSHLGLRGLQPSSRHLLRSG